MRYKRLSLNDAKAIVAQYDNMNDIEFRISRITGRHMTQ